MSSSSVPKSGGSRRFHNLALILETGYSVTQIMDCLLNEKENLPKQMADLLGALLAPTPELKKRENPLLESLEHVQSLSQWSERQTESMGLFQGAMGAALEGLRKDCLAGEQEYDPEGGGEPWKHFARVLAAVAERYPTHTSRYVLDLLGQWTHAQNPPPQKNRDSSSPFTSLLYATLVDSTLTPGTASLSLYRHRPSEFQVLRQMLEDRVLSSSESPLLLPRMARKKLLSALVAMEIAIATPRESPPLPPGDDGDPALGDLDSRGTENAAAAMNPNRPNVASPKVDPPETPLIPKTPDTAEKPSFDPKGSNDSLRVDAPEEAAEVLRSESNEPESVEENGSLERTLIAAESSPNPTALQMDAAFTSRTIHRQEQTKNIPELGKASLTFEARGKDALLPFISPVLDLESHSRDLIPVPTTTPVNPVCTLISLSPIGRAPVPLFAGSSVVIGRSNMCDVVLSNPMISRVCSEILVDEVEGSAHFVLTSYTTNVQINGDRITLENPNTSQSWPLIDQDLLTIGRVFKFKFQFEDVARALRESTPVNQGISPECLTLSPADEVSYQFSGLHDRQCEQPPANMTSSAPRGIMKPLAIRGDAPVFKKLNDPTKLHNDRKTLDPSVCYHFPSDTRPSGPLPFASPISTSSSKSGFSAFNPVSIQFKDRKSPNWKTERSPTPTPGMAPSIDGIPKTNSLPTLRETEGDARQLQHDSLRLSEEFSRSFFGTEDISPQDPISDCKFSDNIPPTNVWSYQTPSDRTIGHGNSNEDVEANGQPDYSDRIELIREVSDSNLIHNFGHFYKAPIIRKRGGNSEDDHKSAFDTRRSFGHRSGERFRPEAKVLVRGERVSQKHRLSKLSQPPRDLYKEQINFLGAEKRVDSDDEDNLSDGDMIRTSAISPFASALHGRSSGSSSKYSSDPSTVGNCHNYKSQKESYSFHETEIKPLQVSQAKFAEALNDDYSEKVRPKPGCHEASGGLEFKRAFFETPGFEKRFPQSPGSPSEEQTSDWKQIRGSPIPPSRLPSPPRHEGYAPGKKLKEFLTSSATQQVKFDLSEGVVGKETTRGRGSARKDFAVRGRGKAVRRDHNKSPGAQTPPPPAEQRQRPGRRHLVQEQQHVPQNPISFPVSSMRKAQSAKRTAEDEERPGTAADREKNNKDASIVFPDRLIAQNLMDMSSQEDDNTSLDSEDVVVVSQKSI